MYWGDPGLNLRVALLLRSDGVAARGEAQQGVGAGPGLVDVHEVGEDAWHLWCPVIFVGLFNLQICSFCVSNTNLLELDMT